MKRLAVFSLCLLLLSFSFLSFTSSAVDDDYLHHMEQGSTLEFDDNYTSTSPQVDENGYIFDEDNVAWYKPPTLEDYSNTPFQSTVNAFKSFSTLAATSNSFTWGTNWYGSKWVYKNYYSLDKLKSFIFNKYYDVLDKYPSIELNDDRVVVIALTKNYDTTPITYFFVTYLAPLENIPYANININKASNGVSLRMSSNYPILYWGVNDLTGEFVSCKGSKGLSYAPYFNSTDQTLAKKFSGLSNSGTSSVALGKCFYVDYSISDASISTTSNLNTKLWGIYCDGKTQPVEGSTTAQLWGVSSYPNPDTYSQVLEQERHDEMQNTVNGLGDKIKSFITGLGDRIKGFFTDLSSSIANLFKALIDDLKGLFIPANGYFDALVKDMQDYFKARFGFLYELPSSIVTLLNTVINFKPLQDGYYIHFPQIQTPSINNGSVQWHTIIVERDYQFDFLNQSPFNILYTGYRSMMYLAYVVLLVNLAIRKFNDIFGGD